MTGLTQGDIEAALNRFVHEGRSGEWERALTVADGPSLLIALAGKFVNANEQELIILRQLAREIARQRPELTKCFDRQVVSAKQDKNYWHALQELEKLLKDGVPSSGSREEILRQINERAELGCSALNITGRIRTDLLEADLDEERLARLPLADLLDTDDSGLREIARHLTTLEDKRNRPPPARRARLSIQAAKILLITSHPEDFAQEILRLIGTYCCRQAEVYSEIGSQTDAVQDYALEAVRYQKQNREFPVALYFHTAHVQFVKQQGGDPIPSFNKNTTVEDIFCGASNVVLFGKLACHDADGERARILGLALLRLAYYEQDLALRYFSTLPHELQSFYIDCLSQALGTLVNDRLKQFELLANDYRKRVDSLQGILRQASQADSLTDVGEYSERLQLLAPESKLFVSLREQEAIKYIVQAAARCRQAAKENDPAPRRSQLRAGLHELRRASHNGRDLSFGILYINPLVKRWERIILRGIEATHDLIRPVLSVHPYKKTLLRRGEHGVVQLQLTNDGKGVATGIGISAHWCGQPLNPELNQVNLTPGQHGLLTLSGPLDADVVEIEVEVHLSCTDVEGSLVSFPTSRMLFTGPPADFDFEKKRAENPFNAGDIVKNQEMFMGRDQVLQQLEDVVTAEQHRGALRLLFGQKRVGKSSILYFLDERLSSSSDPLVICGHVTWLNFATHRPGQVLYEIAKALVNRARLKGLVLPKPIEQEYADNYSIRFNDLLEELFLSLPGVRVTLLIDEFDKAYNQFTDVRLGYDEPFFGYLRGLSLRDGVSVILAGGEELPAFLRDLGSTYNNARRIRVSYLDRKAVGTLIRNKYVSWLDFPEPVIDSIAQMTHGNPYFTQMICSEVYEMACDQCSLQISTLDVDKVCSKLISELLGTEQMAHLFQFDGHGKLFGPALIHLLSRDASQNETPAIHTDDLWSRMRADSGSVRQALNILIEREIVESVPERPSHVRIVMPLFAAWFRDACPLNTETWNIIKDVGTK